MSRRPDARAGETFDEIVEVLPHSVSSRRWRLRDAAASFRPRPV